MKPIIEFDDYRDFLKERFQQMKGEKRSTSLQTVSRKVGLSKPFLTLVLNKKRQMSLDSVAHLEAGFKLTPQEREYLIFLICFNVIADSSTKDFFAVVLRRLRALFGKKVEDTDWQADNDTNIFFPLDIKELILTLAEMPGFQNDADWILAQISLNIPKEMIVKNLKELEELGGIEKFLRKNNPKMPYSVFHQPTKVSASRVTSQIFNLQAKMIDCNDPMQTHSWMAGFLMLDDTATKAMHVLQKNYQKELAALMENSKQPNQLYSFAISAMKIKK